MLTAIELATMTPENIVNAVTEIIEKGVSEEQAVELATSEAVLEVATREQAQAIFDAIDVTALTESEALEIVAAVQDAPTTVRKAFEKEINAFDGKTDTYVPLGSLISVGLRRVLIVSTAFMIVVPAVPSKRS